MASEKNKNEKPEKETTLIGDIRRELKQTREQQIGFQKEYQRRSFEIAQKDAVCNKIQGRLDALTERAAMLEGFLKMAKGGKPKPTITTEPDSKTEDSDKGDDKTEIIEKPNLFITRSGIRKIC